ncbi:MAG: NADPH-dependent glutamate synthase [Candidatus Omnitrophica bacterium]|nr:NADPH-dependent glutamate synthase [Candidatus Omnitrophota bacterium]
MRQKVRQQLPKQRIKNFNEVSQGLSEEQAIAEAKRCLQCKQPKCIDGCPIGIDIPAFISFILQGRRREALWKIKEKNNLPAICGRVCPQEDQCEKLCLLNKKNVPINIGALERYAADCELDKSSVVSPRLAGECLMRKSEVRDSKVAIAGSGPAGLTTAADLAKIGYSVLLFESLHIAGGVLSYGIPEFRLPKVIVHKELEYIESLGVRLDTDVLIGRTLTLSDLFAQGVQAIFLAVGAGLPQFLAIPGENLGCVYSANEFLTRINLMKAYRFPEYATPINIGSRVAVIGGGNVAFDCARVAIRLGRQTQLVYRRTEKEMPARREEIENAKSEGLPFRLLTQPIKILSDKDGFVCGLECIKMELGAPDDSGRRRPVPVQNSNFVLDVDTVIVAVGQKPNPLLAKVTPNLKINPNGTIWVDENLMTSISGVFAGGDIITGADTVISAMGAGKKAAVEIDRYVRKLL